MQSRSYYQRPRSPVTGCPAAARISAAESSEPATTAAAGIESAESTATPVTHRQQEHDAIVLTLVPHSPSAKDGVSDVFDGLAFERRDGHKRHLRAGGPLDIGAVLLERSLAGCVNDAGEVADVAFRLERLPIDGERQSGAREQDGPGPQELVHVAVNFSVTEGRGRC